MRRCKALDCMYCKGKLARGMTTCPQCGAPVSSQNDPEPASISDFLRKAVNTVVGDEEARKSGKKNRYLAALFGIFLGAFGVHNFYLGRTGRGVVQILLFWTGISAVWGFIEGLLCLFGQYKDGEGRPLL